MKKLVFMLFTVALLTIAMSVTVCADYTDKSETLLVDLGIAQADADLSSTVTRGDFAIYLSRLLKAQSLGSCDLPFEDVSSNSPYYEAICQLYTWDVISSSQYFRPNDEITRHEAVKMVVTALGYDYLAAEMGGWPNGYTSVAAKLDMSVPGTDIPRTGELYELLYDTLHARLPEMTVHGDGITLHNEAGSNLLAIRWGLTQISDIVEDVQFYGFNRPNGTGEGRLAVGDTVLYSNGIDADLFFGHRVDAYYDSSYRLLSIYSYSIDDGSVKTIYSTQNIQLSGNTYSYEASDDKIKNLSFADDALIIYNGKPSGYISSRMIPERGRVDLIYTGSRDAVAVVISSYDEYVVLGIAADNYTISDKLVSGRSFRFDEDDASITYTNQNGEQVSFENILKNDILWIAVSNDGTVVDVVICRDIIIGELNGINDSYITIDNGEYDISSEARKAIGKDVYLGEIVIGYINPNGEIVDLQKQGDSDNAVGYLIESMYLKQGLSSALSLKILTESGKIAVYEVGNAIVINGSPYKGTAEEIYQDVPKDLINSRSIRTGLVTYQLNQDREIISVNYADDVMSDDAKIPGLFRTGFISKIYAGSTDRYIQYRNTQKTITSRGMDRIFAPTSAILFQVPSPQDAQEAEDSDYKVMKMSSMNGAYFLNRDLTGYSVDPGDDIADYVLSVFTLADSGESVSSGATLFMVSDIRQAMDSDGNQAAKIILVNISGNESFAYAEDINYFKNLGLKKGDLIKINTDHRNYVLGVHIIYRQGENELSNYTTFDENQYKLLREDKSVLSDNPGMDSLPKSLIVGGSIYYKGTESVKMLSFTTSPSDYTDQTLFVQHIAGTPILRYDSETDTISSIGFDSIKSFEDFGADCSHAVMEISESATRAIYIYE